MRAPGERQPGGNAPLFTFIFVVVVCLFEMAVESLLLVLISLCFAARVDGKISKLFYFILFYSFIFLCNFRNLLFFLYLIQSLIFGPVVFMSSFFHLPVFHFSSSTLFSSLPFLFLTV